jgi:hypothetical protein
MHTTKPNHTLRLFLIAAAVPWTMVAVLVLLTYGPRYAT